MRTENIIPISIANGTSTGTGNLNLEAGRVVGVMQFSSSPNNNHNNKIFWRLYYEANVR